MNTDKFTVVNENGEESIANVVTGFSYKDKEYIVYSIEKNETDDNIYVSKLVKDKDGNDTISDIENDNEREEVFKVVEEILSSVI